MDHVNLNALRVFALAARHGSFLRAAEALNISHGAVSQRIKQLEGDLGVVLFDRKPRGVALTAKGAPYFAAVEEALAILGAATAEVKRVDRRITLHLGSSFAAKWLMPRLNAFNAQFPQITLQTEIHDRMLQRNLGRNEVAFLPAKDPARNPAHDHQCLCALKLVAVCSPQFLRPDWPIDTETLLGFPLLQDAHRRWERLIEATGHRGPHSILNFDRSALALDAAIHGHGVAIAPTFMTEVDIQAGRLVTIWNAPQPTGEFLYLEWPRQYAREQPMKQTVAWILSQFAISAPT